MTNQKKAPKDTNPTSDNWISKAVNVVERIRTPLALAGLVIIVLGIIYKQILSLPLFTPLKSAASYSLLNSIVVYLFILALCSMILGAIGYMLALRKKNKNRR